MILNRTIRALPYVAVAALLGVLLSLFWGIPPALGAAGMAATVAVMIGRTIWKERHEWNALADKAKSLGVDL